MDSSSFNSLYKAGLLLTLLHLLSLSLVLSGLLKNSGVSCPLAILANVWLNVLETDSNLRVVFCGLLIHVRYTTGFVYVINLLFRCLFQSRSCSIPKSSFSQLHLPHIPCPLLWSRLGKICHNVCQLSLDIVRKENAYLHFLCCEKLPTLPIVIHV